MRFSLRTLIFSVLLLGSAGGLWWRWEPWAERRRGPNEKFWFELPDTLGARSIGDVDLGNGSFELKSERRSITVRGHEGPLHSLTFSPNGQRVATASSDCTARVWDADDGRQILLLRHREHVREAVFSPNGRVIATLDEGGFVSLWDAGDGRLQSTWKTASGFPFHIRFFRDGERVLLLYSHFVEIVHLKTRAALWTLDIARLGRSHVDDIAPCQLDDTFCIVCDYEKPHVFFRRRPEYWYGLAWLPELWLTVVFSFALLWSLRRDRQTLNLSRMPL